MSLNSSFDSPAADARKFIIATTTAPTAGLTVSPFLPRTNVLGSKTDALLSLTDEETSAAATSTGNDANTTEPVLADELDLHKDTLAHKAASGITKCNIAKPLLTETLEPTASHASNRNVIDFTDNVEFTLTTKSGRKSVKPSRFSYDNAGNQSSIVVGAGKLHASQKMKKSLAKTPKGSKDILANAAPPASIAKVLFTSDVAVKEANEKEPIDMTENLVAAPADEAKIDEHIAKVVGPTKLDKYSTETTVTPTKEESKDSHAGTQETGAVFVLSTDEAFAPGTEEGKDDEPVKPANLEKRAAASTKNSATLTPAVDATMNKQQVMNMTNMSHVIGDESSGDESMIVGKMIVSGTGKSGWSLIVANIARFFLAVTLLAIIAVAALVVLGGTLAFLFPDVDHVSILQRLVQLNKDHFKAMQGVVESAYLGSTMDTDEILLPEESATYVDTAATSVYAVIEQGRAVMQAFF
ncbi:hypothetical protein MPSEU_000034300 [Mayamaea pseudoterrestris]|nr:hypothetical protein MPSEU_000034300 [Mayamaea pseudoterrestris]